MRGRGGDLARARLCFLAGIDLSLSGSVFLGKSHPLSRPQSPHLRNQEAGQMSLQTPTTCTWSCQRFFPLPSLCDLTDKEMGPPVLGTRNSGGQGPILACASSHSPQPLLSILKEPDWKEVSHGLGMKGAGNGEHRPFLLGPTLISMSTC